MRRIQAMLLISMPVLCVQVEIERELPKFRGTGSRSGIDALLRSCLRLRHEMASFATSLQYYIMFEVLEGRCTWPTGCCWRSLVAMCLLRVGWCSCCSQALITQVVHDQVPGFPS